MVRSAGLAGLAARELHAPGVITAAVVGSTAAAHLHLAVIAQYLPSLSHVALYTADPGPGIGRRLLDQLEVAGIGVSTTTDVRQAAFGANVLVMAGLERANLEIGQLAPGVLLVNAASRDLPDELIDGVDQLYVDDLALVRDNQHRNFVKLHLAGLAAQPEPLCQRSEGWCRPQVVWRHQRRIDAELSWILTGRHHGRTHLDDVLLVELLSERVVDIALASRLQQAAVEHGLGAWSDSAGVVGDPGGTDPARVRLAGREPQ
jgi:ornithine cyclodeaminase/alanine dehydrogenase-like protein (mu-crystallin family)